MVPMNSRTETWSPNTGLTWTKESQPTPSTESAPPVEPSAQTEATEPPPAATESLALEQTPNVTVPNDVIEEVTVEKVEETYPYRVWLIGIASTTVATAAAGFSVYGVSHLLSGAFYSVMVMGIVLEICKFVTVSALHWYWSEIKLWLKSYLLFAVGALMIITSGGIYGFLTNAYQKGSLDLEKTLQQVEAFKETKARQLERKAFIDKTIADTPAKTTTQVKLRQQLIAQYDVELKSINAELDKIYTEEAKAKQAMVTSGADVGPIIFVAKAFNTTTDKVANWLILAFIVVFDPLAVALVLVLNHAVKRERTKPSVPCH